MSQSSQASTIPYEYSQDDTFLKEITEVDSLYFKEGIPNTNSYSSDLDLHNDFPEILDPESYESPSTNDESDTEIFAENINPQPSSSPNSNTFELSSEDQHDEQLSTDFFEKSCDCSVLYAGTPCSSVVDRAAVTTLRQACLELDRSELDLVVKASLLPHRNNSLKNKKQKDRQKPSQRFFVQGKETCKKVFCYCYGIGNRRLKNIAQSLDKEGLIPRCHGNTKRLPYNALTYNDRDSIKQFIVRYANENAVPLPGRLPNFRDSKVLLLPSDNTKADIFDLYNALARDMELRSIGRSTFYQTWSDLCPYIVLSKPATDLCQKCQALTAEVSKSGTCSEEEKAAILEKYHEHVNKSKLQRDLYREQTHSSKIVCSSNPVVEEKQVFYLANEGEAPGKGANTVLSYVHHYLEHYGLGEEHAEIHFDNCSGQNKNNAVLSYALWRVMTGRHLVIEYNLMLAGHTKFSPDWHFGLWKSRWRHVDAETVQDVAVTIQQSSRNGHNVAHILSDDSNPVTFYDWTSFFKKYFKPLKKITQYHSFCVRSSELGVVVCKEFDNSAEEKFSLLKNAAVNLTDLMPDETEGKGLDPERQWYLYDQIRQFCRSVSSKEQVCPEPSCGKQSCKRRKVQVVPQKQKKC